MTRAFCVAAVLALISTFEVHGQEAANPDPPSSMPRSMQGTQDSERTRSDGMSMEHAPGRGMGMDGMMGGMMHGDAAGSMSEAMAALKAMAEMCQEMLRREMAMMPYRLAAGVLLAVLLAAALVLLIALEVQWLVYWRRRLKGGAG